MRKGPAHEQMAKLKKVIQMKKEDFPRLDGNRISSYPSPTGAWQAGQGGPNGGGGTGDELMYFCSGLRSKGYNTFFGLTSGHQGFP